MLYEAPMHQEITEAGLAELVRSFYARVRRDEQLGPIFEAAVDDWDEHLDRLTDFWSSVMLTSGRYKGNPFGAHRPLPLDPDLFEVWLGLWRRTTAELFAPPAAAELNAKAERIADSLMSGLFFRPSAARG